MTNKKYTYLPFYQKKQLGKDNKLDYDSGAKQLKNLPEPRMQPTLDCMNQCRDAGRQKKVENYNFPFLIKKTETHVCIVGCQLKVSGKCGQ